MVVDHLLFIGYYGYAIKRTYPMETHEYWELVYIDKGSATVILNSTCLSLQKGSFLLIPPQTPHVFKVDDTSYPNTFSFGIVSSSALMENIAFVSLPMNSTQRSMLSCIFQEVRKHLNANEMPMVWRTDSSMVKDPVSYDMIRTLLEGVLLISISKAKTAPYSPVMKLQSDIDSSDDKSYDKIIQFFNENINNFITLSDISRYACLNQSSIEKIFKERTGGGAVNYFYRLKMERAKCLMRESDCSLSEIAFKLGFSSIQFFSRRFKMTTGMSPSSYLESVQHPVD